MGKRGKTKRPSPIPARIARAIAMGPAQFILWRGVLAWGLPMFVLFTVLPVMGWARWFAAWASHPVPFIAGSALVWFGGGFLIGRWMWTIVCRQHAALAGAGTRLRSR